MTLPDSSSSSRTSILNEIMHHLYSDQFEHWNAELMKVSCKNSSYHNRSELYAVHYKGRRYYPININALDDEQTSFCLLLHPDHPELEQEMDLIADQMSQLEKERYSVSRFIRGLLMLNMTPEQFQRILGEHLYSVCTPSLLSRALDYSDSKKPEQEESIKNFAQQNQDIIDLIGERRLINVIVGSNK